MPLSGEAKSVLNAAFNKDCRVASPKISVIIPVHNESANIDPLCEALVPVRGTPP